MPERDSIIDLCFRDSPALLRTMAEAGVELAACRTCVDLYGVSKKLEDLDITVK